MKTKEYPNLYQSADKASTSTQRVYVLTIIVYLVLLTISSLLTQYAPKTSLWAILSIIFLFLTLGISLLQAFKRYEKIWYNGRAVAESIKTRTWRYIMRSEPYYNNENIDIPKRTFISDIQEILNENRVIGKYLEDDGSSNCITTKMSEIRALPLDDRKEYYISKRIDEQRKWYAKKAKWNNNQSKLWFGGMILANLLALIFSILQILNPQSEYYPVTIFIVIAGAILSWMQVKRFQDLATSYNLTAHEISTIREISYFVKTEVELSDFVIDSENAFSREHTQWIAKRNK
jgi:hypothetical protein